MPDSTVIQMENPLMTQARGMTLWSVLRQLPAYTPSEVKWRGNPCVELGDILQFEATKGHYSKHIVCSQRFHFANGFYVDSTSLGEPMTLKDINALTVRDKELNQIASDIEEKVSEGTDAMRQAVEAMQSRVESLERNYGTVQADLGTCTKDVTAATETAKSAATTAKSALEQVASLSASLTALDKRVTALEQSVVPVPQPEVGLFVSESNYDSSSWTEIPLSGKFPRFVILSNPRFEISVPINSNAGGRSWTFPWPNDGTSESQTAKFFCFLCEADEEHETGYIEIRSSVAGIKIYYMAVFGAESHWQEETQSQTVEVTENV